MSLTDTNFRVVSDPDAPDYVVKAEGGIDLYTAVAFQEALLDGLAKFPTG
jgi:anti-anti-sigma regulatory factor